MNGESSEPSLDAMMMNMMLLRRSLLDMVESEEENS